MQLHEANWILLITIAKLNQSVSSGASEQPNIKIGMKKIVTMRRVPINVRETSAEEPMLSPNKDYHHKCCIPE